MAKSTQQIDNRARGIIASAMLFVFAIWLGISIIGGAPGSTGRLINDRNNPGGPAGELVSNWLNPILGYSGVVIAILMIGLSIARASRSKTRKTLIAGGKIIVCHAILAGLLGLPKSGLSIDLVGNYGNTLANSLISVFGSFGAYVAAIVLFLGFVAVVTRLDINGSIRAAGRGALNTKRWFSGIKKRRVSRREVSRAEIFDKYNKKAVAERSRVGITGSIIPGEIPKIHADEPIPEPVEELQKHSEHGSSSFMEFIPPPIKRTSLFDSSHSEADKKVEASPPPPSGPVETIYPKKLIHEVVAKKDRIPPLKIPPLDPESVESMPVISHEPPLPEPLISDDTPKTAPTKRVKKNTIVSASKTKTAPPSRPKGPYKYTPPPLDILIEPEHNPDSVSDTTLHKLSQQLIETLRSFNVDGEIRAICPGPVITRFELKPAVGIKVSRISNLADDLALALKAQDIRIVAPIPGKGVVGIEVPNANYQTVRIKSELATNDFQNSKFKLPLALGKRVDGTPAIADLTRMPHLLIAGATGSGKSVCINTLLTSLIYSKSPEDVRLVLIDPKRLELSVYKGIPHLAAPIIVEPKHASVALNWATAEMDARYKKLSAAGVRSIADYNSHIESNKDMGLEKLPYIVIVVDEMADLMVTVSGEIEEPIARIAQMARAVGIHLIIATQRPSVDVITGLIKANFPSRIAFKVRSKIDSRTILDMGGAERLLGRGDMLYLPSGYADPVRIHGCLITTEETERVVNYLRTYPNPYPDDMLDLDERERSISMQAEQDDLFWEAAKIIVMYQQGSTSFLQRKLRVGYTRAGCIIDQLEQAGVVGPFQGSKAREVLIKDLSVLDEMKFADVPV